MKTYKVESDHRVHTDSFSRGEGRQVNSYQIGCEIQAETPREAVEKYFRNFLCFDFDFDKAGGDTENGYSLAYDVLCDSDNAEVKSDDDLYKSFREEKVDLYNNHVEVEVYELVPIKL
jgi:hypothetical protein